MRVWRDIFSPKAWKFAVAKFKEGDTSSSNAVSTASTADRSLLNKARGVFDKTYSSPAHFLDKITAKIESYHGIRKDEYKNLETRIKALEELSRLAGEFLEVFKVDMAAAARRSSMTADKDPVLKAHTTSNPRDETMDRLVLTLNRRSLRKANYLKELKKYYGKGGAGAAYANVKSLLSYIQAPQENASGLVGLTPHVRLEQLDPVHRSDYEADTAPGSCGYAFKIWASSSNQDTPFFLWMENSMVSVADDKAEITSQSVPYERHDLRQTGSTNMQKVLIFPAPLQAICLDNLGAVASADTPGYRADFTKDPVENSGIGMAAFVWTEEGEVFIGQHAGHVFHHSSFVSGRRVRCAGMLRISNGRITLLSNNSGHYKPRKDKVRNFVRFLKGNNALDSKATLIVHTGATKPWQGDLKAFEAQFNTI